MPFNHLNTVNIQYLSPHFILWGRLAGIQKIPNTGNPKVLKVHFQMVINKWYPICSVLECLECSNFECHQMLIKMFRILMVFGKKTAILPTIQKLKAIHNRNAIQPFEYPTHFLSPHCICYPHKTYLTNGSSILKVCKRLPKQKDLNTGHLPNHKTNPFKI